MLQNLDLQTGLFENAIDKSLQHDFPKMRGGQRPFGTFLKIHPFWWSFVFKMKNKQISNIGLKEPPKLSTIQQ